MKRSVCLDCYRQSMFLGEMTLADVIREIGSIDGVTGFHATTESLLADYPEVTDAFLGQWKELLGASGLTPVTLGSYIDRLQFRDHVMTEAETADALRRDLNIACKLGFQYLRIMHDLPLSAVEAVLPLAQELDVCLLDELMPPGTIRPQPGRKGMDCQNDLDLIARTGTKHFGLQVNLGLFQHQPNPTQLMDVLLARREPEKAEEARQEIMAAFGSMEFPAFEEWMNRAYPELTGNRELFQRMFGVRLFGPSVEPPELSLIGPHLRDVYAKYICMFPASGQPGGCEEPSIPYPKVMAALTDAGYQGYLASLRMGAPTLSLGANRDSREISAEEREQVRLHQQMLAGLLG